MNKTLSKMVNLYLTENGIKNKVFSDYVGISPAKLSRWLIGKDKLNVEQMKRTQDFLSGKHLKSIDELMQEGEQNGTE